MPRRIIDLNGNEWSLGQAPAGADPERARWEELEQVAEWLPATVPGNVQADLVAAGRLKDPNLGLEAGPLRQAGEQSWWLVRRFALSSSPGERAHLILRGIDYIGDLFLNGQHLGRHEGMFAPQMHDVTGLLQPENQLAVRLLGSRWLPRNRSTPWYRLLNSIEARLGGLPGGYPHRRDTLKCQMGFGWDFSPALLTMGLWDDVYLAVTGHAFIEGVTAALQPRGGSSEAKLRVNVTLDTRRRHRLRLVSTLAGETFVSSPLTVERGVELAPGGGCIALDLTVPEPRLWWPWDHGDPDLYRLTVEAWDGDQLQDAVSQTIGLRWIELDGWTLHVNGAPIYARGANWVPASLFPGRVTDQDYDRLLRMARKANMNLLRVWAGGLREKRAFYDTCDRLGLLVWQEFPFACAFLTRFPQSPEYLDLVRAEAQGIVRDIRHHPCLAVWCGGNELSARRNAPLIETLRQVATEDDPTRPFLPVSPGDGDHHNWRVWHNFLPPSAYQDDDAGFASEFGLQAPPSVPSLCSFLPPGELWPPGPDWTAHGADLRKLWRYARPFLPAPDRSGSRPAWQEVSLTGFVSASQRAQLHGLRIAVEHFRRRKAAGCGGVLVWQLNEPWPAVSWAVIGFSGQPKPAYSALRRLFSPVLISLEYPLRRYAAGDRLEAQAWIINDAATAWRDCELRLVLRDEAGQTAACHSQPLHVDATSAAVVARLQWTLPPGSRWLITCLVTHEGHLLTANHYDLAQHDSIRPTLRQRLRTWLLGLFLHL
jgi:beta-mannosidase